jgi:hypothetical protein
MTTTSPITRARDEKVGLDCSVTALVDSETFESVRAIAHTEYVSQADVTRAALREYIAAYYATPKRRKRAA